MSELKLLKPKRIVEDASLKNIIDEMINEVKSDKEVLTRVKELGIDTPELLRKNIATISTYKEELDYCRNCPGFNKCNKRHPHYLYSLEYENNFLRNNLVPCKLKVEDDKKDECYVIRDFPASWRSSNLDTMDKSKARECLLIKYAEALDTNKNWVYINGSHRSGKSFAAATLLNEFITELKGKAVFINYPTRVRDLQDLSYSNKEDFINLINLYSTVDILCIDDFGNEYKNEFIRDSITLAILNERARRGLVTIFTSAFSFEEIGNMYQINSNGKARARQLVKLLNDYAGDACDITTVSIY